MTKQTVPLNLVTEPFQNLPSIVQQFVAIEQQCRALKQELKMRQEMLRQLEPQLCAMMKSGGVDGFTLTPHTPEEEAIIGKTGSLQCKTRTWYERLTGDKLEQNCGAFFRWLMGEDDTTEESVETMKETLFNFIWGRREIRQTEYIERVSEKPPAPPKKRPRPRTRKSAAPTKKKKAVPKPDPNFQPDREVFWGVPKMRELLTTHDKC